jgi:para-nitrobenzyl esterase
MGQSAGAMSVQQHCLSPLSEGLFHRAIMSSGGGVNKVLTATPVENHYDYWKKVMEYAGCENLEQFRAVAPKILFEAWNKVKAETHNPGCFPCIDGRLVVGSGTKLLAEGAQHHIPYMAGSTSEDMMPPILFSMSRKWNAVQPVPSYTWYFDRQLPGDDCGAWHSADLWYWFGTLEKGWRPWEQKDIDLSEQMVAYLCNFVRCGNPNKSGELPTWIASDKGQKRVLCMGERNTAMKKPGMLKMIKTMLTNKAVGE